MKLRKLHLFLILLGVLAFGCLGARVVEGLETKENDDKSEEGEDQQQDSTSGSLLSANDSQTSTNLASNSDDSNSLETYGNVQEDGNFTSPSDPSYFNSGEDGPQGVAGSNIAPGDQDLYVLKSQIVPPVCPACPTNATCPRQEPCQPCPPCARCPEPSFECKRVPNYSSANSDFLPRPLLTNFSEFGI